MNDRSRAAASPVLVLRVGLACRPPLSSLTTTLDWFARTSGGHWTPRLVDLGAVTLPRPVSWYAPVGGMAAFPRNSQALAAEALVAWRPPAASPGTTPVPPAEAERIVLIVPRGFRPHVWRLRNGGCYLGGGVTCRSYALLPDDASPWAVAHELAHLHLELPDLGPASGQVGACLMAPGPDAATATEPAAPCAPLLVRLGWRQAVPLARETRVRDLPVGSYGSWRTPAGDLVLERPTPLRLVPHVDRPGVPQHPCRLPALTLDPHDADRPLLAVAARAARAATAAAAAAKGGTR